MSFSIAVASGKGGTGKTTVAVCLFEILSSEFGGDVSLVDCDVEEPNDLLFFENPVMKNEKQVTRKLPRIDTAKCTFCRKCVEYCEFNAITVLPPAGFAKINPELCHSCGACLYACNDDAIRELEDPYGSINTYEVKGQSRLTEGRLQIGSTLQTMLIRELKKKVGTENGIRIFDAPPGTSCPVVETISGSDFVVLVTEPTPFGLHDLKLMIHIVEELALPYGIIINKAGLGDQETRNILDDRKALILGEIPFSQEIAQNYAVGDLTNSAKWIANNNFDALIERIKSNVAS